MHVKPIEMAILVIINNKNIRLFFLTVLALIIISFATDINADDKRKGFIGDLGIGFAYTELAISSGDGKLDQDTSNGPCFSARVGYGFNEHFFLYAVLRESSYFYNKWVNDDFHHGGILYGLGMSYFIDDSPNSLYITAAYGIGDLDSGDNVDKGDALLFGAGYLTASHFAFEFSYLNLSVKKDVILENDFDANSFRFLIRYIFY